jgi:hypothetical protein
MGRGLIKISINEPVGRINIDSLSFEKIKEIVPANVGDPLLYDCYELSAEQVALFNKHICNAIDYNFNLYYYVLICLGLHD